VLGNPGMGMMSWSRYLELIGSFESVADVHRIVGDEIIEERKLKQGMTVVKVRVENVGEDAILQLWYGKKGRGPERGGILTYVIWG